MTRSLMVVAALSVSLAAPLGALAHGGGLNACGCHVNHKTGACHCHRDTGKCGCSCQPESCGKKQGDKPSSAK